MKKLFLMLAIVGMMMTSCNFGGNTENVEEQACDSTEMVLEAVDEAVEEDTTCVELDEVVEDTVEEVAE